MPYAGEGGDDPPDVVGVPVWIRVSRGTLYAYIAQHTSNMTRAREVSDNCSRRILRRKIEDFGH